MNSLITMKSILSILCSFVLFVITLSTFPSAGRKLSQREQDKRLYLEYRHYLLSNLCGKGVSGSNCGCDTDSSQTSSPPVSSDGKWNIQFAFDVVSCEPNFCDCPDGKRKDSRPEEMQKVMNLCPLNEMESCSCINGKVVKYPFDLRFLFFTCRPTQCRCKGDEKETWRTLTAFACAKGGFPYCAHRNDFYCTDGSKVTEQDVLESKMYGNCSCPAVSDIAESTPICKSTGEAPICPDGSPIDLSVGGPGMYYTNCLPK